VTNEPWLTWVRDLQAHAANGLTYAVNAFDRERYGKLQELAEQMLVELSGAAPTRIAALYLPDAGHVTPKVDVRAAVIDDEGRILLVRERSDGGWAMPGGWADVTDSPATVAVRETVEEAGMVVRSAGLIGVYHREHERWNHPPQPWSVYKIVVRCELVGVVPPSDAVREASFDEVSEVGFFAQTELPPLSLNRNSDELLARVFKHLADPSLPADLD
jgi:ADP-ribose pyrophosphatase YjhB (NUDIX family)